MRYVAAAGLSFVIVAFAASAQDLQQPPDLKAKEEAGAKDPLLESAFRSGLDAVKLEATAEEKTASILLSSDNNWHFKLSGPIDKSSGQSELANLRGLSGSAKAEIGWRYDLAQWHARVTDDQKWDQACADANEDEGCDPFLLPADVRREFVRTRTRKMAAISADYTRTKFSFVTPLEFKDGNESHAQYSGMAGLGIFPLRAGVYFAGLSFRYEVGYKEQGKKNICTPITGTTATECRSLVIGAPTRSLKRLAELEVRWYRGTSVAAKPTLTYDFNSDTTGIELPVYFVPGKNGLTGGVAAGWRSDEKEFVARVFVGVMGEIWK